MKKIIVALKTPPQEVLRGGKLEKISNLEVMTPQETITWLNKCAYSDETIIIVGNSGGLPIAEAVRKRAAKKGKIRVVRYSAHPICELDLKKFDHHLCRAHECNDHDSLVRFLERETKSEKKVIELVLRQFALAA